MIELPPEENIFETVMVDVTHRCNMACANCYLPDRTKPDMDIDRLVDCLSRLPRRTNIRIAGAEPTMRRDLPDIISRVKKLGHRVVLLTNGLRLAREDYVRELKDAGLGHVYISMNGADNDNWYEAIDTLRCADKKMRALQNCADQRLIINTGTILVRGVNEAAVHCMIRIIKSLNTRHALLRFKNVGALGRYDAKAERQNLTMQDMESLMAAEIGCPSEVLSDWRFIKGLDDRNTRLFPLDLKARFGSGIWVKLTDWAADEDGMVDENSKRRGRVTENFMIAPFFDDVVARDSEQRIEAA